MRIPKRKEGKYSQMPTDFAMTQEKFQELQDKRNRLRDVIRPRAVAEMGELAEGGDFSENAGYQAAKARLRGINTAILRLDEQLKHAVIIPKGKNTHVVSIGSFVTVEVDGARKEYQILGSLESDPAKGIISRSSPLGTALLGRKVGATIIMPVRGKQTVYAIVKIG